ncbi:MAG: hypothetical protein WCJ29_03390 [bacterium]
MKPAELHTHVRAAIVGGLTLRNLYDAHEDRGKLEIELEGIKGPVTIHPGSISNLAHGADLRRFTGHVIEKLPGGKSNSVPFVAEFDFGPSTGWLSYEMPSIPPLV